MAEPTLSALQREAGTLRGREVKTENEPARAEAAYAAHSWAVGKQTPGCGLAGPWRLPARIRVV